MQTKTWELRATWGDRREHWFIYEYDELPTEKLVKMRIQNFLSYHDGYALDDVEFLLVEIEHKETVIMNVFEEN